MKLFVVGEDSPDPAKWSIWSEWSLVIAPDEAAALQMLGESPSARICEVPMDKPLHVVTMTEPNHGDDI